MVPVRTFPPRPPADSSTTTRAARRPPAAEPAPDTGSSPASTRAAARPLIPPPITATTGPPPSADVTEPLLLGYRPDQPGERLTQAGLGVQRLGPGQLQPDPARYRLRLDVDVVVH